MLAARLIVLVLCIVAPIVSAVQEKKVSLSASTLGAAAALSGRYFGTALATYHFNDGKYTSIADREFNCVTAENEMKWETIEGNRNQFNFGPGDQIVSRAQQHGQKIRGHTLVWHEQLPQWVKNLAGGAVGDAVKNHIYTVMQHYKGKVFAWDVVNEAFEDNGAKRSTHFLSNMGDGYIEQAFRWARDADSSALLCYNDYNMEWAQGKINGVYNMVADFKKRGVPIDCVGFQGHVSAGGYTDMNFADILRRFSSLGVVVQITELDVSGSGQSQANTYAGIVKNCMAVSGCTGVTVWGVTDNYSWHSGDSPLIWDSNGNPKAAYNAVLNQLNSGVSNACATNNGGCGSVTSTQCSLDASGNVTCSCKQGYTGSPPATPCTLIPTPTGTPPVNECATNNGGCGPVATTVCTPTNTGAATCTCVSGYTGNPPYTPCTLTPISSCDFKATDVGSNNWYLSYNIVSTNGKSIKSVSAQNGGNTITLSGPNNWGPDKPAVYTANPSSPVSTPFSLIVTPTSGAATTISVTAITSGSTFSC